MQPIRSLLRRRRLRAAACRGARGLSTAELIGVIVVVGILGALGGTYIKSMVSTAQTNTGNQHAIDLTTALSTAIQGGVDHGAGATYTIDTTSAVTAITALNAGVTAPGGMVYQLQPPTQNAASYTLTNGVFTYNGNGAPP